MADLLIVGDVDVIYAEEKILLLPLTIFIISILVAVQYLLKENEKLLNY